jgi:hypothetical protein
MARGIYDGNPPGDQAPYTARYSNYGRLAICFHCRCVTRLDQDAGNGTFLEHSDVDRTSPRRTALSIKGVVQTCPGSGTTPIPLAYKFPDGDPLPYYSRH